MEQRRYQIGEVHKEDKTYYSIDIVTYHYAEGRTSVEPECEPLPGKLFDSPEEVIEYVKETMKMLVDVLYDITHYPMIKRPF